MSIPRSIIKQLRWQRNNSPRSKYLVPLLSHQRTSYRIPAKKKAPVKKKVEESEEDKDESFNDQGSEGDKDENVSLAEEDSEMEEIPKKKATKKKVKITKEGKTKTVKKATPSKQKKATKATKGKKASPKKAQKSNGKAKKGKKEYNDDEEEAGLEDIDPELIMPGQTQPTPPEGDGVRIFYESFLQQKPFSQLAEKWCMEHGLLERDKAQAAYERYVLADKTKKKK